MTRPTVERRQRLPKLPHTKFVAIFFEMRLRDFIHALLPVPIKNSVLTEPVEFERRQR